MSENSINNNTTTNSNHNNTTVEIVDSDNHINDSFEINSSENTDDNETYNNETQIDDNIDNDVENKDYTSNDDNIDNDVENKDDTNNDDNIDNDVENKDDTNNDDNIDNDVENKDDTNNDNIDNNNIETAADNINNTTPNEIIQNNTDKNDINKKKNNTTIGPYEIVIGLCAKIKTKDNVPLNTHFDLSLEQNLFKIFNKDSYTIPLNIKIKKRNNENTETTGIPLNIPTTQKVNNQQNQTSFKPKCGCKKLKQNNLPWNDLIVPNQTQEHYLINNTPQYKSINQYRPQLSYLQNGESIFEASAAPVRRTPKRYFIDPLVTPNGSTYNPQFKKNSTDNISNDTAFTTRLIPYETGSNYIPSESIYIDPQLPNSNQLESSSRNTYLNIPAAHKEKVTNTISYIDNQHVTPEPKSFQCPRMSQCQKTKMGTSVSQCGYPSKRAENTVKHALQMYEKQMEPMQQVLNEANQKLRKVNNNCKCRLRTTAHLDTNKHSTKCKNAHRLPQDFKNTNVDPIKPGTTFNWSDGNVKCPYIRKIVAEEGLTGPFDVIYTENPKLNVPNIHGNPTINVLSRTVELGNVPDEQVTETTDVAKVANTDIAEVLTNDVAKVEATDKAEAVTTDAEEAETAFEMDVLDTTLQSITSDDSNSEYF